MTEFDACASHFTGKERDAESGLDYFGARYYGPNMGRFMSPDWADEYDPIPYSYQPNPQTLNLYSFARNNPFALRDLDGHQAVDVKTVSSMLRHSNIKPRWESTVMPLVPSSWRLRDSFLTRCSATRQSNSGTKSGMENGAERTRSPYLIERIW
jgi:RHS repeat-associated protein